MVLLVRLVARPGKTAAVGEAAEQGKITPGLQWSCGDGPICQNVIPRRFCNSTKAIGFFIVSKFAYVTFEKRNNTNRMPTTNLSEVFAPCLQPKFIYFSRKCLYKKALVWANG